MSLSFNLRLGKICTVVIVTPANDSSSSYLHGYALSLPNCVPSSWSLRRWRVVYYSFDSTDTQANIYNVYRDFHDVVSRMTLSFDGSPSVYGSNHYAKRKRLVASCCFQLYRVSIFGVALGVERVVFFSCQLAVKKKKKPGHRENHGFGSHDRHFIGHPGRDREKHVSSGESRTRNRWNRYKTYAGKEKPPPTRNKLLRLKMNDDFLSRYIYVSLSLWIKMYIYIFLK